MNSLIVVLFAVAAAVQAMPYYDMGPDMGLGYDSGSNYGDSGYGGGRHGYMDQGFGNHIFRTHHDIGHQENDYDASVHHHQAEDHNIGGLTRIMNGGHNIEGYDGYHNGHNIFRNGYQNAFL